MSIFATANTFSPCPNIVMGGFPYAGNAVKPETSLRAVPVPPYTMGGTPGTVLNGIPLFPVKPLPGSGGSGGSGAIGSPIDSG